MAMYTLKLDGRSIEELLKDPKGPVGDLLDEIAGKMTAAARGAVPYMEHKNFSWSLRGSSQYFPWSPGWTAASIWHHPPAIDKAGQLYAGTNAMYAPTNWLEHGRKGKGGGTPHPFLSAGLFAATV